MPSARRAEHTHDPVAPEVLAADVDAVLTALDQGEVAIIPTCLTYAVVGHQAAAVARIFAAKARSHDKPCGLFGSPALSRALHDLPDEKHEMAFALKEEEGLPFSIVAPFRTQHPFLAGLEPGVLALSSKAGTMDMVVSGGPFVEALAAASLARGIAVFGSSANRSLAGSKYRLEDIEPEVRAAAGIAFDYGLSRYATRDALSSTIIDFSDFSVVRVGHRFDDLAAAFSRRFGITLGRGAAH